MAGAVVLAHPGPRSHAHERDGGGSEVVRASGATCYIQGTTRVCSKGRQLDNGGMSQVSGGRVVFGTVYMLPFQARYCTGGDCRNLRGRAANRSMLASTQLTTFFDLRVREL
jgi:hypothetical protein